MSEASCRSRHVHEGSCQAETVWALGWRRQEEVSPESHFGEVGWSVDDPKH